MDRRLAAVAGLLIGLVVATPARAQDPSWPAEQPTAEAPDAPIDEPPPGWDGTTDGGGSDDRPGADAPPPDQYEPALQPYGVWGADPRYGRFWRPSVTAGWQPYWDGRWAYSPWGWTWLSYEPWSWTYHYGRWSYLPAWGWAWLPGYQWGPAWVSWNWSGGYVGWAPLGYWGRPAYNQYVFVRDQDFCAPYVGRRVVRYDRLPRGAGPLIHWRDHPGQPPSYDAIRRVVRHPMTVVRDRPQGSVAPWDHGSGRRARTAGPLVLDRDGRRGVQDPRAGDRLPATGAAPLDHALRPFDDRRRDPVDRPGRRPDVEPAVRPPLVAERGSRDGAGSRRAAPAWFGVGARRGGQDVGQVRAPLSIDRGRSGGGARAAGGDVRGAIGGGRASMGGGHAAGGGGSRGGGIATGGGSGGSRGGGGHGGAGRGGGRGR